MSGPEGNSFVFPSLNVSQEEVEGKQNLLFPEGTDIKCFVIHSNDEQIKQSNEQISINNSTPEHDFISSKHYKCTTNAS